MSGRATVLAVLVVLAAMPSRVLAFEAFLGTYVGRAELVDTATKETEERDIETVIERYGEGGFRVEWRSVVLRDGRRDVPGVRLVIRSLAFAPSQGGAYFVSAPDYDPFTVRDRLEPMSGDAIAWATVQGDALHIFAFAISDAGAAELQHHQRTLTEAGMDLAYLGMVGGRVTTDGVGRMVRVD